MLIHSPHELALLVANERKRRKLSQATVGQLAGLKQQTISEFELKPESTLVSTLFQILSAVNLDIKISTKDEPANNESQWKKEW